MADITFWEGVEGDKGVGIADQHLVDGVSFAVEIKKREGKITGKRKNWLKEDDVKGTDVND